MRGRTEENIKGSMNKMHRIAEIIFNQELEVIPSFIDEDPPEETNSRVWFLGKSIELLSQADYFIGVHYIEFYSGCNIEREVARSYGIEMRLLDPTDIAPDIFDSPKCCETEQISCCCRHEGRYDQ